MRIPATLGGGNTLGLGLGREEGKKYLAQKWEGGTLCDKSGVPRSVEVQVRPSYPFASLSRVLTTSDSSTAALNRRIGSLSFARLPSAPT
jgi:hypothetical protein